ncbi:MAG: TRAP transporter large permease [Thermodesulfobacteriota bacterium]|nr:TRAP transporter large permease [Thermodesulfobacteriota bacterium]
MNEVTIGILGLAVVMALFLTGIELGFAMALVGFLGFSYIVSFKAGLNLLAKDIFDVFANYGFTVIPLFVLMGQIAFNAGIAKRLYDTSYRFIGHIPGGLAMATVGGAAAFGTVTGSAIATAATFGSVAYPEMDRYHYSKKLSTGIIAVSGTLGSLIPPSVTLIVYGMITETSIGKLFLAATVPGLIVSLLFISIIYGWCKINPSLGPKGEKSSWKERWVSLKEVIWVILIFVIVTGGMAKGFFTPTEAGSAGTFAVLLLSVIKRDLNFEGFIKSVAESLRTACMVLMLIAGSTILGHFLVVTKIPIMAADWVGQLPYPPFVVMIFILLIYELGGSFIDDLAFMVLATPIFFPIVLKLGYDPIWFGVILHIFVMIGVVIPPVAVNVFVVRNITKVPFGEIYSGVYPFLIGMILCAALLFVFPQLITFLPSLFEIY